MTAGPHGDAQVAITGELDDIANVPGAVAVGDYRRRLVHRGVPDRPGRCEARIARRQDIAGQAGREAIDFGAAHRRQFAGPVKHAQCAHGHLHLHRQAQARAPPASPLPSSGKGSTAPVKGY